MTRDVSFVGTTNDYKKNHRTTICHTHIIEMHQSIDDKLKYNVCKNTIEGWSLLDRIFGFIFAWFGRLCC